MWSNLVEKFKKAWEWFGHADQTFSALTFGKWFLGSIGMSWASWLGNLPLPFIVLSGLCTFGVGLIISNQWLWRKQQSARKAKSDATKLSEGRCLVIEYSQAQALSVGPIEGHGLDEGPWLTERIVVTNKSSGPLHNVRVGLVRLVDHDDQFPSHLTGSVSIPLALPFAEPAQGPTTLNHSESRFIAVFHYHQAWWNPNIRLGHLGTPAIYSGPYAIEIEATSQEGASGKSEFIIGLLRKTSGGVSDPYLQPVWMPSMTLGQVRDRLIALCADGVHLRNEVLPTEGMLDVWRDKYEIWRLEILQTAKRFDRDLRHKLWPLNEVPLANLGSPVNGEHQQALNIISEVVSRAKKHLNIDS
jgi:hypothetical protein